MVNRVWTGIAPGGDARNPYNWGAVTPGGSELSPGLPNSSDSLFMYTGGTMNVTNNNLAGDTLTLSTLPPASLNLASYNPGLPAPVHEMPTVNLTNANVSLISQWNQDPSGTIVATINARGANTVTYLGRTGSSGIAENQIPIGTNFNIASHSTLAGLFTTGQANFLNVNGHGVFAPSNLAVSDGGTAVINANTVGVGTISASGYHYAHLTFGGSVGSGQSITLDGATLVIDKPHEFAATVNVSSISPYTDISLVGLPRADSWSLNNDMLRITSHGHTVDSMHLVTNGPSISVYQNAGGIDILAGHYASPPATAIALTQVV